MVMENLLDSFKVTMGLPPDVNFSIKDPFLDRFKLIDPVLTRIQNHVVNVVEKVRNPQEPLTDEHLTNDLLDVEKVQAEISLHLQTVNQRLRKAGPAYARRGGPRSSVCNCAPNTTAGTSSPTPTA